MKNILGLMFFTALISTAASAELVLGGVSTANYSGTSVPLLNTANIQVEGGNQAVGFVGAGLRTRFTVAKVYVAQLFTSDPSKFVRSQEGMQALDSLDAVKTVVFQLTFLRNVDANTIKVAFDDSLSANGVNVSEPAIQQFLAAVDSGGPAINGKTFTFVTVKGVADTLYYEGTSGVVAKISGPGLARKITSIWLGKLSNGDAGLEKLKQQIISGGN